MMWKPGTPYTILFHRGLPGEVPPGWADDLLVPDASMIIHCAGVLPFNFAIARLRIILAPKDPTRVLRPAILKALAGRLSLAFSTHQRLDAEKGLLDLPTVLIDASVPPGLIDPPESAREVQAAAEMFPLGTRRTGDCCLVPPLSRVLDKLTLYSLQLRSASGWNDFPEVSAMVLLMGVVCEEWEVPGP